MTAKTFGVLVLCCLGFFVCSVNSQKFRICIADPISGFKRAPRYCPSLDGPDSKFECVLGLDRLDCLRKVSKGKADLSVFTSEDLVTASNSAIDVLIVSELRYTEEDFEYQVVAVVNEASNINSREDFRGKRLCHPGYGYEAEWSRILANYLESSVVRQTCQPTLTLTENRISASANFFGMACKAGPWVNNPQGDRELKSKYPNLCKLCDVPSRCATTDKYWGRRGPLYCLTDGAGDVSWARLDDVRRHFGLTPGLAAASPEGYRLFCPDGTTRPVNTSSPCVWVVKPWPVIATKRELAQDIKNLIGLLTRNDSLSWQSAFLDLVDVYYSRPKVLDEIESIESYLDRATGYLSANSFSGCHPPRTVKICTTSNLENAKCSWLRESASVYGIEPDLECLKADNKTHCMEALNDNVADVMVVPPDYLNLAQKKHKLKTLFYETADDTGKYLTVPIVKSGSGIATFEDLEGKKACFPFHDGIAWNSVLNILRKRRIFTSCSTSPEETISEFFGSSCVAESIKRTLPSKLIALCNENNTLKGDFGALKCLIDGADVAFVSENSLRKFLSDRSLNPNRSTIKDFTVICPDEPCHLSWSPPGYVMVRGNSTDLWLKDTLDVFLQIDRLFGRDSPTTAFSLFSRFDGQSDVLFHDDTVKFKTVMKSSVIDLMQGDYVGLLRGEEGCGSSAGRRYGWTVGLSLVWLVVCGFVNTAIL